jgi:hypothetical protein
MIEAEDGDAIVGAIAWLYWQLENEAMGTNMEAISDQPWGVLFCSGDVRQGGFSLTQIGDTWCVRVLGYVIDVAIKRSQIFSKKMIVSYIF